jgi:hypothetical protein
MRIDRVESIEEDCRTFVAVLDDGRRVDVDVHAEQAGWRVEIALRGHAVREAVTAATAEIAFERAAMALPRNLPWSAIREGLEHAGAFIPYSAP